MDDERARFLADLRGDLRYTKLEVGEISSYGDRVNVYKAILSPSSRHYTVVVVPEDSASLQSEIVAYNRATSLQSAMVQTGYFPFRQDNDICFAYYFYEYDLKQFIINYGFRHEVLRDVLYAMHYVHHEIYTLHGDLSGSHKIAITFDSENNKFKVRLTGFGEYNEVDEIGKLKDCNDLANILSSLHGNELSYFDGIMRQLRTKGCEGLYNAFCFLEPLRQLRYLEIFNQEVVDAGLEATLNTWYRLPFRWDWRSNLEPYYSLKVIFNNMGTFIRGRKYDSSPIDFLRFCRNVSQHSGANSMVLKARMGELYSVWSYFFDNLHLFCSRYNIVIHLR